MEKAGLRLARTFRMSVADLAAEGVDDATAQDLWPGDDVEYALTRDEWERLNESDEKVGVSV